MLFPTRLGNHKHESHCLGKKLFMNVCASDCMAVRPLSLVATYDIKEILPMIGPHKEGVAQPCSVTDTASPHKHSL